MAWCSRTARSTGPPGASTATTVGPGSYSSSSSSYQPKPSFAAFGSSGAKQAATDLLMRTPGPGAYENDRIAHVLAIAETKSSFFKSTSERSTAKLGLASTPGPGSYKGAEVSFIAGKRAKPLSPSRRRRSSSDPIAPKSGKVKWIRVPTAPSIPHIGQSFGYEEGPKGQMIAQKPAHLGHSGRAEDLTGPGEYDPLDAIHRLDRPKGTNFAKSRTVRDKPTKKDAPGPGAYDPDPAPLRSAFAKPSAVFQSNLTREKAARPVRDATPIPGPGAYKQPVGIKPARKPEHLQFFGSTSSRFEAEKLVAHPSPVYTPEPRPTPGHHGPTRHAAPFASTQDRFETTMTKEQFDIGPGSYEASSIVKELSHKTTGRAGVFGSTTRRFEAPKSSSDALLEKILEHSAGAASASNQESSSPENAKKKTSSFASGTARFVDGKKDAAPCVGDYEISMSWDKPGGRSTFASHLTRDVSQKDKLAIPGPGAYSTPDVAKLQKPLNRRGDVFVSTEPRFKKTLTPLANVGPGAYNPDTIESDWNRPTYNITIATEMERRLA
ncbi:hypothetical protein SPRG_06903 [Saprolegnia parasitica CBS 223.65]|uniref:Sperm-tail PG-rich repeat-containing protein 2 n=1 Tax=Saprolegnia parasitica (strain CBS 223.65) TaxID=695850 RepID=A0A067CAX0_SAPPC|nr:hypothetical protein SPRG_06903 [Saprolegnia parasitica CBS 223.65]KDO27633.1 hypothetical protein SPRG_06903 [Saprolegnia parasitica CBS 223.65]|eukprot:XP_012201755.1 hypothetical protein SPRG_06903 [Saprolegnia parasitica CBS 223.65]